MLVRNPARAAAIAAAVTASLAVSAPALIASGPAFAAGKPAAKPQKFTAQGLVVSSTATTMRVITERLKVGTSSLPANTVVIVKRPAGKGKAAADVSGYTVTLSGTAIGSGKSLSLTASQETSAPAAAEVFLGVVTSTGTGTMKLAQTSAAGGGDFGVAFRRLTVDTSTAAVSVDGATGTPSVGDFAIVLGERDTDTIMAATVEDYTDAPDVEAGRITAVSGTAVTFSNGWQNRNSDDPAPDPGSSSDPDSADPGATPAPSSSASAASLLTTAGHNDNQGGGGPGDNQPGNPRPSASVQPSTSAQPGNNGDNNGSDNNSSGGGDQGTTVDLAAGGTTVPVVLNGQTTTDLTKLANGQRIVVLGETTGTTFTPTIAFVFDRNNRLPARRHHA